MSEGAGRALEGREPLTDRAAMLESFPQFQQNFSLSPRMAWEVWKRGVAYGRSKAVPADLTAAAAEIDQLKREVASLRDANRLGRDAGAIKPNNEARNPS